MTALPDLTACRVCDAIWRARTPAAGERVRCGRCGAVMRTGRRAATDRLLALALAAPPLMLVGLSAPFLALSGGGAARDASVLDAARAVATDATWPLAFAVGALIAALPLTRAAALIYALAPLRLGRGRAPGAARAFHLAIALRPWAMAEIFLIGVAVALVKIAGLASVTLGPAFWAFALLAALALAEDAALCERSVWDELT